MSEENTNVTEPEDDAALVHDEAAEEKAHDELVADMTKLLEKEQPGQKPEESAGETGEGAKDEKPSEDAKPKDEKPDDSAPAELSQDIQTRAEAVGISNELAERLHQSGQLEEVVAMSDRRMIEYVQAQSKDETKDTPKERREQQPPPQEDQEDVPDLDQDLWEEDAYKDLVKRDVYHQRRIDALGAQVDELLQERHAGFDEWFDGAVNELDRNDLFGKGTVLPGDKQGNRDTLFQAYKAVCLVYDVDPNVRDKQMAEFAFKAKFPKEVEKQIEKKAQKQTLDRLRDSEGKFLSSSKSKGGPPPKAATDEEAHDQLVSDVTAYLKEQGVQMSGV